MAQAFSAALRGKSGFAVYPDAFVGARCIVPYGFNEGYFVLTNMLVLIQT